MLPKRARLIARVLVTHRTEENFGKSWDRSCARTLAELGVPPTPLGSAQSGPEIAYFASNPRAFPYNDLYGFVDVYWDGGTRILANAYFRGDARRRAGKVLRTRWNVGRLKGAGYYLHSHMRELAWFPRHADDERIRTALLEALLEVERLARELKGNALTSTWRRFVPLVQWTAYLRGDKGA
jgi:hypothetical protein